MEGSRFDTIVRSFTKSRRSVLGAALAATTGWLVTNAAEAKKKRKHGKKPKKPKPNAFGCLEVGGACMNDEQCCSGICEGRKGNKRCRAHGTGTCDQEAPGFCAATDPAQALCDDSLSCVCLETTGGGKFCGSLLARPSGCADCQTDADCLALGAPPGSACVPFATGACADTCEGGMACVAPCEAAPRRSALGDQRVRVG